MTDSLNLNQAVLDARSDGPRAEEALRAVLEVRRSLARTFLGAQNSQAELERWLPHLINLVELPLVWQPGPEDVELQETILHAWASPPEPRILLAAMCLAPAHVLPSPPRLRDVASWLRITYARYALGFPAIFFAEGESEQYALHMTRAMSRVSEAVFVDRLDDSISLARVVHNGNSSLMYFNRFNLIEYYRDRARLVEWLMLSEGRDLNWLPSAAATAATRSFLATQEFARAFAGFCTSAVNAARGYVRSLLLDPYALDAAANDAADAALQRMPPALRLLAGDDLLSLLLIPNLLSQQQVPKSDLRAVDLGAGTGRLWQRLLEAGVEIVVHGVEPSFPPAPGLDPLKLLRRRLSERFDLVGVSSDVPLDTVVTELNGAQAKPLIVIARVDVGEEPAAHKSGEPAVAEMERQGFDCVTFGHRTERGIDEHLVTFRRGYGDLRHAGATQATIVFYRSGDPWLLSLLCFLFESYSPGHLRSTAVAAAGTPASSAITVVR